MNEIEPILESVDPGDVEFPTETTGSSPGPQGLTLTLLGDYVLPHVRPVWSGGLVRLLGDFGITTASARLGLSRLARKDLIKRSRQGRLTYYSLGVAGARLLTEGRERIFSFGLQTRWDGNWTIVTYSVPEDQRTVRERLRKRLAFLGFRSIHDGTWFSPRNHEVLVGQLLEEMGLIKHAEVFVGRPAERSDPAALVARCWDLSEPEALYASFVARYAPYVEPAAQAVMPERTAFMVRTTIMHEFRRFPALDPEMPEEIVGDHWQRAEAVRVFHRVWHGLAPAATRYFADVTTPGAGASSGTA